MIFIPPLPIEGVDAYSYAESIGHAWLLKRLGLDVVAKRTEVYPKKNLGYAKGVYDEKKNIILILKDLPPKRAASVLSHELSHAVGADEPAAWYVGGIADHLLGIERYNYRDVYELCHQELPTSCYEKNYEAVRYFRWLFKRGVKRGLKATQEGLKNYTKGRGFVLNTLERESFEKYIPRDPWILAYLIPHLSGSIKQRAIKIWIIEALKTLKKANSRFSWRRKKFYREYNEILLSNTPKIPPNFFPKGR